MTRQTVGSFLIRLEVASDGHLAGTLTSVQTGEQTTFGDLSALTQIFERSRGSDGAPPDKEEDLT